MKKFLSLVLALVMALSLTTVAWGATTVNSESELENALAAGGEVVLGSSFSVADGVIVPANVTVTLDLNGCELSMVDNSGAGSALILNKGNLTIKDSTSGGKITYKSNTPDTSSVPGYATNAITNAGNLTVLSGTIENTTAGGASYAIDTAWTGSGTTVGLTVSGGTITSAKIGIRICSYDGVTYNVNIDNGEISGSYALQIFQPSDHTLDVNLNITGGTFDATSANYPYALNAYSLKDLGDSTFNISGGTFEDYVWINANDFEDANVNISGGTFEEDVYVGYATGNNLTKDNVSVSGGTFNGDYGFYAYADNMNVISGGTFAADVSAMLADDYKLVDNGNGSYSAEEIVYVAETGGVQYETLAEAVSAAAAGGTVKLLANNAENVTVGKALTFDFNGKNYTGTVTTASGYVYVNGKVMKTTSAGNTSVLDVDDLTVTTPLGAAVDTTDIISIVKVAATTNKTTVDGKTTTTVVPAWYQIEDAGGSGTFVECDKTSADLMFTFKGVGSVYVRRMAVPAAFDATPVTLYTAPLKATCDKVGQDNDVYVVSNGKYYATDSTVVAGAEKYALLSNGKMVVYYGEATAKPHNWAQATKQSYDAKTGTITSVKCPDCKNPIAVYAVPGSFDGKTYKQITDANSVAYGYYYVAGAAANTTTGVYVPSTGTTDKVQSAETFDAGIAMYVGMSVMAAAGSAVVIGKKKD